MKVELASSSRSRNFSLPGLPSAGRRPGPELPRKGIAHAACVCHSHSGSADQGALNAREAADKESEEVVRSLTRSLQDTALAPHLRGLDFLFQHSVCPSGRDDLFPCRYRDHKGIYLSGPCVDSDGARIRGARFDVAWAVLALSVHGGEAVAAFNYTPRWCTSPSLKPYKRP